jgi:asparagine synthase (glutamine-hydrolysing)
MCAITGIIDFDNNVQEAALFVEKMADSLSHRGPDANGFYSKGPVVFGFRRLSIIDLETGNQPLFNEDQSICVMCNGEIYNYVELTDKLKELGHIFRTRSDTEVIVHAYEAYGLDFVKHLEGMFAIALWDSVKRRLILVRDRVGKKPLFYAQYKNQLAFSSELKALLSWPYLNKNINAEALHNYFSFLYIPSPDTIFEQVHKLDPAHILIANYQDGTVVRKKYWDCPSSVDNSKSLSAYQEELQELLHDAVAKRLRSDVPVGVLLSGGIDSSIITGLVAEANVNVKSFCMGFDDRRFDESGYAQTVASFLKTDHIQEMFNINSFGPQELLKLVWFMDEPFGDSSFIPMYWISRILRQHVKVALSGDGGDELFAGYPRYQNFQLIKRYASLPVFVRKTAGALLGVLQRTLSLFSGGIPEGLRKLQKAAILSEMTAQERMYALTTYYDEASKTALYSRKWRERLKGYQSYQKFVQQFDATGYNSNDVESLLARDFHTNLVDDYLVKVDRASMACGLEVRCPYLDHRVVELVMRMPLEYKLRAGRSKYILKETFKRYLPPEIRSRPKHGFEIPFAEWFSREPWRTFLIDTLSPDAVRKQDIFNVDEIMRLRDQFLKDPQARNASMSAYQLRHRLWLVFMFNLWHQKFMS